MGGNIEVESVPDKGSTFWFDIELPVAPSAQKQNATNVNEENEADKNAINVDILSVLIAEDNTVNQMLVTKLAQKRGWTTHVVADGVAAVRAANEASFDIILMDIQMPKMTGDEAAKIIRSSSQFNKNTPILALTANCLADDVTHYKASGMNGVIAKPIKLDTFYRTVSKHTAKQ